METEKIEAENCEECIYYETYETGTKDCRLCYEERTTFCPLEN